MSSALDNKIKLLHKIKIDADLLAKAIGLDRNTVIRIFKYNGRLMSYILVPKIAQDLGMTKIDSENAPAGVMDSNCNYYLIRTMTKKSGVSFSPQSMKGSGRKFNRQKFYDHVAIYKGFVVVDANSFPVLSVYLVPSEEVERMDKDLEMSEGSLTYAMFHNKANGGYGRLV